MKKRLLTSIAAASLTIAPALPLITSCSKQEKLSEVHIININDFHGAAPGYGDEKFDQTNINNPGAIRLVNEWEAIKAKYPGTVVLSGGDLNAGEGFSTCTQGETFYPVLKQMGIDYSAVGNHAWEWGSAPLENYHYDHLGRTNNTVGSYFFTSNVLNGANYREKTWVSDPTSYRFADDYNLWKQVRVPWADPFKMLNLNGHNVCLIGLTTKDTLTDGNMESMKTLSFIDYNASVVYSKAYAYETLGEEEYEKIDAFILDTHLECQATDPAKPFEGVEGEAAVLAKDLTTRIDGIFAAHSHMICSGIVHNDNFNQDIPIAQGGQAGRRYVDASLVFDDSKSEGNRLKSIKMDVVKPYIAGIEDPSKPDKAAATKQIKDIVASSTNARVIETANEYDVQRAKALNNLESQIGTMYGQKISQEPGKPDKYGVPYWYTDGDKGFGTNYLQSPTLLDAAGVWADIAMVQAFNQHYDKYIHETKGCYPISIGFTNVDSLKSGFTMDKEGETSPITKKQIFQMHSFENPMHYGCITVDQLRQYINYFLAGAGKFDYGNKTAYDQDFYYEPEHTEQNKVVWDANETVNVLDKTKVTLGTSYVSAVNQFYGISFSVKRGESKGEGLYEYTLLEDDAHPLLIYDPNKQEADLYNKSTWVNANEWKSNNGYIPIVVASFTWQGGNAQNRMLHHWFDYNGKKDTLAGHQIFDMYTRGSALEYIDTLTKKGWVINQVGDNEYIDDDFIKQMLNIVIE